MKIQYDKFYTNPIIAKQCYDFLIKTFDVKNQVFLEPSAGNGAFLPYLKNYIALDIEPEADNIIKKDFFTFTTSKTDYITIGNPPFGKRSKTAIDFFNHASQFSSIIAFILPISFLKWSVQKQLNENFVLYNYFILPENAFEVNGSPYDVNTAFMIWVKKNSEYDKNIDKRLYKSPATSHEDFEIWQYNATPEAIKYIDEDWEFATYRQGYNDYNHLFTKENYDFIKEKMTGIKKQQFFFIKPLTEESRQIIKKMNFNLLAQQNTTTPGFGKGDFVAYYEKLKEEYKYDNK